MYNTEAVIYDYKQKLEEYRETIGVLPTDVPELLVKLITIPSNVQELRLAQHCLTFLFEKTDFYNQKLGKFANEYGQQHTLGECLFTLRDTECDYQTAKKAHDKIISTFPQLVNDIKELANNPVLLEALTNPKSDQDISICYHYKEYLYYQVKFAKDKKKYFDELEGKRQIITKLEATGQQQHLLEILLDPKDATELKFCTAFFKLHMDLQSIEEAAYEGRLKDSNAFNDISYYASTYLHYPEMYIDKLNEEILADSLFNIAVLKYTSQDKLLNAIAQQHPQHPSISDAYNRFVSYAQNKTTNGITRSNPNMCEDIDRFCKTQQIFHKLCRNGINSKKKNESSNTILKTSKKLPSWLSNLY